MRPLNVFNLSAPSSRTKALGFTQPLTTLSTSERFGGKEWPALKAGNLIIICEPIA
jgi:hypothetical protein